MTTSFDTALERTLGFEGGLSDNALDRGGRTNYGITQVTYDRWRSAKNLPCRPVDLIEDNEVRDIYHEEYWETCNCDALPERLAAVVFDMAVNSGPWNAKLTLQRALGTKGDGVIGPETIRLANDAGEEAVLRFLKRRACFIEDLLQTRPSQVAFLSGWIGRLLDQAWRVE